MPGPEALRVSGMDLDGDDDLKDDGDDVDNDLKMMVMMTLEWTSGDVSAKYIVVFLESLYD